MSKKELRKQLEKVLNASIISVLNSKNRDAAKKSQKTVAASAKAIARKFFKSAKPQKKTSLRSDGPSGRKIADKKKPSGAVTKAKARSKGKK